MARAAFIPAAPDRMKLNALANIALSPDASSASITTLPASRPRRSSPDFTNVTSFIGPPRRFHGRFLGGGHFARLAEGRQPTNDWTRLQKHDDWEATMMRMTWLGTWLKTWLMLVAAAMLHGGAPPAA